MSSIVTITFSPCIDKSTAVAVLVPDKKLRCEPPKFEPGGGGINVARAIRKLGGDALAVYPAGGYTGSFFNDMLKKENIPSVIIETEHPTRENMIIMDLAANKQYRFGMPGTILHEKEWKQCLQSIEEMNNVEYIVASGSLPPGVPTDIYGKIAVIAKKKNARLVIDTSGDALKAAVKQGVYLLKPNLGELASLVGKEELDEKQVHEAAGELIGKGLCEIVVVSMASSGALLITKNESYRAMPPLVKPKSTVGAGDSMVAGLVLSLDRGRPLQEVLQYGVACGTAATMNAGTELCSEENVEKLFPSVSCSRIY
jgi:6-phosphofructokinase 2